MSIQTFSENLAGRDFVIGDIHGCYSELMTVLEKLKFDKSVDRMFAVGDLVDRGYDSEKCLLLTDEHWFHSIRGNHEQMLIDYNDGLIRYSDACRNGGSWYVYMGKEERVEYYDICNMLPLMIEIKTKCGKVGLLHAEFPAFLSDWDYLRDHISSWETSVLWSRKRLKENRGEVIKNISKVICGHTPQDNIKQLGNQYWIDLGGVWSKKFGVVDITNDKLIEVCCNEKEI